MRHKSTPKAKRKARTPARKRERISPRGDTRFVRRSASGQFDEADDAGRSLAQDVRRRAKTVVKAGQGDKGDQRRRTTKTTTAGTKRSAHKRKAG